MNPLALKELLLECLHLICADICSANIRGCHLYAADILEMYSYCMQDFEAGSVFLSTSQFTGSTSCVLVTTENSVLCKLAVWLCCCNRDMLSSWLNAQSGKVQFAEHIL